MPPPFPFKVKTKLSWPGEEDGDLGFLENEIIEVFSFVDDSWWSGKLRRNGAEGIFPKEYVVVLEDKMAQSASSRLLLKPSTPIRDNGSRSNTPQAYKLPKKINPDVSYDAEEMDHADAYDPRPRSQKALPGHNRIRTLHHGYRLQEDLLREREMEHYRQLQQKQHYHVKKTHLDQQKRMLVQPEAFRNSALVSPEAPLPYLGRSRGQKQRPQSQMLYEELAGFASLSPALNLRTSYDGRQLFHNNTVESFSPEPARRRAPRDDFDELSLKRAQLELELQQLKLIEKSKKLQMRLSPCPEPYDSNSSYVSEDLLSSKKNYHSRDDLGRKLIYDDDDPDFEVAVHEVSSSPPPPPPPKHSAPMKTIRSSNRVPYDADDFRFSGNSHAREDEPFRLSKYQQEELKTSIKSLQSDVLNLLELSATSAGSFMRHKYEKALQTPEIVAEEPEDPDSVFETKRPPSNIFKKLLKRKSEANLIEQRLQKEDETDWATLKHDLNRINSLTSADKQKRTRRIVREEGSLIVKPLDYISEINVNETVGDIEEAFSAHDVSFKKVEAFMDTYDPASDLNDLISDISVKFNASKLHQLRAVLVHLCKFHIVEEPGKILQTKPKLAEVLARGEATIYQLNYLFKKVLDALRVPSELVLGFWKKPNEFYHNEQYVINHCWLSVLVEGHYFLTDLFCFKTGSICNLRNRGHNYNEYYFLARPLDVVSTHIPLVVELQHVVPPVDQNIAFYLPRVYLGFGKNGLRFGNFNNALTRLNDLEFFELDIDVPVDVELFTLVKTAKVTTNELSLFQIYWTGGRRMAKIKAILPENETIGVLQVFAGPKGLQKHFDNVHELAVVIPLYHTGTSKPCKFVPRFPTVQSQNNDLYIKQPQTKKIVSKNAYNFEILQHPSTGVDSESVVMNQDFKIVIELPSGKYFKLAKDDHQPFGTYSCNIKCQEVGLYRGLVIGDSGNSWYVFAQWDCVAGTVAQ